MKKNLSGKHPFFIYRDNANRFNLFFRLRALDVKQLIGPHLCDVRKNSMRLARAKVASGLNVSSSNLRYVENGYGASMDAIIAVHLYYESVGTLAAGQHTQLIHFYRMMWKRV